MTAFADLITLAAVALALGLPIGLCIFVGET